ncbi:MAG: histidine kinase [Cyclobacteriaceae bacterium]
MIKDRKTLYIVLLSSLLIAALLNSPMLGALLLQEESFLHGKRLIRLGYNLLSNFVMALVLFQFNLVWKHAKRPVLRNLLSNWAVVILINILIVLILGYLIKEIGGFDPPRRGRFYMRYGMFINLSSMVVIVMLIFRLLEVLFSRQQVALENEKLRSENLQSQYNALKNQLDPHFLFNSLNTVMELIEEDKELAKGFVSRLSEVFRYMLGHSSKNLISLEDEIALTDDYIYLLKIRHSHLSVNFRLADDQTNWQVPPLALQLLIENAVKHNEISKVNPLVINVTQVGDLLEVSNPIQRKRTRATGAGTGLKNLVERYKIVAGQSVIIENDSNFFKVVIPLIRN